MNHTFAGNILTDRSRIVPWPSRRPIYRFTLDELDELAGYVGTKYAKPAAPVAPTFKETAHGNQQTGWKIADPNDEALREPVRRRHDARRGGRQRSSDTAIPRYLTDWSLSFKL